MEVIGQHEEIYVIKPNCNLLFAAKAPMRAFVKSDQPVYTSEQLPGTEFQTNSEYYGEDDAYMPCNAMCSRVCDVTCPKHCCLSVRADLPLTAVSFFDTDLKDVSQFHESYTDLSFLVHGK